MRFARVACLALSLLVPSWPVVAAADAPVAVGAVEQVTLTDDAHESVVLIRTSRPLRYRTQRLASPPRLAVDFEPARFAWTAGPLRRESGPVVAVRGSQFRAGIARIVVALGHSVPYRIDATPDGVRIVVSHPTGAASRGPRAPAPATGASRAETVARLLLYGIVLRGEDSVAYLEDPSTRRVSGFKRGDRVGVGVLDVIEERHVTIQMPSGPIQIRVDDPKPGREPPAPRIQVGPGTARH